MRKPFKFINNVLQTNEGHVNEFPLSLRIHSWPSLGKISKQFLYKYQCTLIFSVTWLGMIPLKYNSFDTDMGIQMM